MYKLLKNHWPLLLILLFAFILRIWQLGTQSIWIDESFSWLAIKAIAEKGQPLLDSGFMYTRDPAFHYPMAYWYKIVGDSPFWLRLPSTLFSMGSILISYFLSLRLFKNKWIALIASALMAFGTFEIGWSRQIRMYSQLQFFYILSTYLFIWFAEKEKRDLGLLIMSFLTGIIAISTHKSALFIVPTYLIILSIFPIKLNKLIPVIEFGALFILLGYFLNDGVMLITIQSRIQSFMSECFIIKYLKFLVYEHTNTLIFTLIGIVTAIKNRNKEIGLLFFLFLIPLLTITCLPPFGLRYIFFIMPFFFMISAHGIYNLYKYKPKVLTIVLPVIIVLSIFIGEWNLLPKDNYYLEYDNVQEGLSARDYTPQPNYKEAYQVVIDLMDENSIFLVAHAGVHEWYVNSNNPVYKFDYRHLNNFTVPNQIIRETEEGMIDTYTGVPIIEDLLELKEIVSGKHGYIILDHYSTDVRIDQEIIDYIKANYEEIYSSQIGPHKWNRMWVYEF